MKCPFCGKIEDKVLESRQSSSATSIRRRRECVSCGYRFTSYERIEESPLMVVKSDGRREPFEKKKTERGLLRAIEKRPVPRVKVDEVLHQIEDEAQMLGKGSREISSGEIGKMVLQKLYSLDKVAYVRFASVYQQFEEVEEFVRVIENLSNNPDKKKQS